MPEVSELACLIVEFVQAALKRTHPQRAAAILVYGSNFVVGQTVRILRMVLVTNEFG